LDGDAGPGDDDAGVVEGGALVAALVGLGDVAQVQAAAVDRRAERVAQRLAVLAPQDRRRRIPVGLVQVARFPMISRVISSNKVTLKGRYEMDSTKKGNGASSSTTGDKNW